MADKVFVKAMVFAPAPAVYRAMTTGVSLSTWFAEHVDVRLDDGRFEFWGKHTPFGDVPRQTNVSAEPGVRLRFDWEIEGMSTAVEMSVHGTARGDTTVSVRHEPVPFWGFDKASMNDFWGIAVGNLANFTEGRTLAPRPDYTVPCEDTAFATIVVDRSPEDVFPVLLDPALIDRWLPAESVVEPWEGGRYEFGWDHGPVTVVGIDAPNRLSYTWHNDGWPDTLVSWELDEEPGEGTRISLRHSGFVDGRPSDGYQLGWQNLLINLQRMVEIGERWEAPRWRHR
ncbi:Uncharacterized conserved protein YndB, AHSA1/START domain [Lentzea fradiae]|uniref:Uncharacterized conserved protein YndB, AHSA1/START domain n=1 Tax=Lentzea fradiae TaxID=200378 RepID=A0A1G7URC6_9PSEU|nr:SRPBCC family protein [Lentzea fradiae]SDG50064.1 Uncharacterized conserved protein YndB, AHSA1/START domain [Lentzea fradiae]